MCILARVRQRGEVAKVLASLGPAIGDWRLAIGDWRLAAGDLKPDSLLPAACCLPPATCHLRGDWRLATGDWRRATGDGRRATGDGRRATGYARAMRTPPDVMPAIVTPFGRRGSIDLAAHRHNVETLGSRGIAGFVIGGSTGEGPYLEPDERLELAAATRDAAPGVFVMIGLAGESLRNAIAMSEEAADGGADAVLALTPTSLVRHRPDLVERFFADLAGRSRLPVFLYSVPRVSGFELPSESAIRLAGTDGIVGMKDSGGHPGRISQIARAAGERFAVYCGASAAISLSVAGGAHGGITASANYAPRLVAEVAERSRKSVASAADAQERLRALSGAVERHGVAGVKYAAARTGLVTGPPRRPLVTPGAKARREIDRALAEADLP
jgi:4-hydroxy-2-oxoglutarate aldolase